jgi:YD repeat-containing protein
MRKITDRFTLGLVSGIIGGAVGHALESGAKKLGISRRDWTDCATAATVAKKYSRKPGDTIIGVFTSLSLGGIMGIPQSYILSLTGKDHLVSKSLAHGVNTWLGYHGLGSRITKTFDYKPKESGVSLLNNLIAASVSAQLITRLGDDRIFGKIKSVDRQADIAPAVDAFHDDARSLDESAGYPPPNEYVPTSVYRPDIYRPYK